MDFAVALGVPEFMQADLEDHGKPSKKGVKRSRSEVKGTENEAEEDQNQTQAPS